MICMGLLPIQMTAGMRLMLLCLAVIAPIQITGRLPYNTAPAKRCDVRREVLRVVGVGSTQVLSYY